jgi:Flp pilus assembly protein TadG
MKAWLKFRSSNLGTVAVSFAISLLPVLLAVGAALDMLRANQAMTALQGAADAAVLAAGASPNTRDAELETIAETYVAHNFTAGVIENISAMKFSTADDTDELTVQLSGEIETSFFALVGIPSFDVSVRATAQRASSGPLELVMALDITDSMALNGKLDALKSAAIQLTEAIMTSDQASVGIVPFADYIKVGTSRKNESWVDVPDDQHNSFQECDTEYPDKQNCTMESQTCYNDGVPSSCSVEVCESWGDPVETNCRMETGVDTWDGCIGPRSEALRASIGSVETPYPGVLLNCGPEIQPLTTDETTVLTTISGLYSWGNTHIPAGLIWGWNMLTSEEPLTEARSKTEMGSLGGKKVLVLMTDGANSTSPSGTGYALDSETSYGNSDYSNALTTTVCDNIKADGIEIYTVLFDVTDPTVETLLQTCASDSAKSYVAADADELLAAFDSIGNSIRQLHLTQ